MNPQVLLVRSFTSLSDRNDTQPVMESVSNTPTIVEVEDEKSSEPAIRSTALRSLLLLLFSLAQFIDIFNISALFAALPVLTTSLEMNAGQAIWVISAYQLTFAAFLLLVSHSQFLSRCMSLKIDWAERSCQ